MDKKEIKTNQAPGAIGPYSQAIKTGNFIFLSGQIGIDPETQTVVNGGIEAQTRQIFKNIGGILKAAGGDLDNVVKSTVLLNDIKDFKRVNEIYKEYFHKPYPARSAFAVKELPLSVAIEIEVIAGF